jgi:hypothetical protein
MGTASRLSLLPVLRSSAGNRRPPFEIIFACPGEDSFLMKRKSVAEGFASVRREARLQQLSELHMGYEGGEREIPIRAPDISLHGMFVNTTTHFPEGAVVKLRFRLTRSNVEVQTRGEVRYCLPGIGIGVEFVGIGAKALHDIEQEIRASSQPVCQEA